MVVAFFSILVALLLGLGAVQEFIVRGVRGGEVQPLLVGLIGMAVSVLLATAGIALWRQWAMARRLGILAGLSSIVFYVYEALPPHRKVGMLALILGVGVGILLLAVTLSSKGAKTQTA